MSYYGGDRDRGDRDRTDRGNDRSSGDRATGDRAAGDRGRPNPCRLYVGMFKLILACCFYSIYFNCF